MSKQPKRPMSDGGKPPISIKSPGKTRGPASYGKPTSIRPGMGDGPDRVGPTRSAPPSIPKPSRGMGGPGMGGAPARDMEGPRGPRSMGGSPSKMGAGMGGGAGGSRPPTMSKPAMGKPPVAGPAPSGGAPASAPKPPGMKKGGRVKKMAMGGKCRGMGAAKMGGKYSKAG